mmetsp:Transcript_74505/g.174802  ORF Transcript_74505/g.174802 Transcript_74505/m.174802 type:complete len:223 (-) Transcript_74505:1330-1998(-)
MLSFTRDCLLKGSEESALLLCRRFLDLQHRPSRSGSRRLPHLLRILQEALHMIAVRRLVQNHFFGQGAGLGLNVFVPGKTTWVHDGHVQALGHCVVEEHAVHGIPEGVQAAEGERQVAQATREGDAWAGALDLRHGIDEVDAVGVVFRQPSGNRQHVAIEDDILGREVDVLTQALVAALADADLVLEGGCLTLLIEGHDDHGCTIAHAKLRLTKKLFLADLQ